MQLVEERRAAPVDDRQPARHFIHAFRTPYLLARPEQGPVRDQARPNPSRDGAIEGLVRAPRLNRLDHDLSPHSTRERARGDTATHPPAPARGSPMQA